MDKKFALRAACIFMLSATHIIQAEDDYMANVARQARAITDPRAAADLLNADHKAPLLDQMMKNGPVYGNGVMDIHNAILKNLRPDVIKQLPEYTLNTGVGFRFALSPQADMLSAEQKTKLYQNLSPEDAQNLIKGTNLDKAVESARATATPQPSAATAAPKPFMINGLTMLLDPRAALFGEPGSPASPADARPTSPTRSLTYESMRPEDVAELRKATPEEILAKIKTSSRNILTVGTMAKNLQTLTTEQVTAIMRKPEAQDLPSAILKTLIARLPEKEALDLMSNGLKSWTDSAKQIALKALNPQFLTKLSNDDVVSYRTQIAKSEQLINSLSVEQLKYLLKNLTGNGLWSNVWEALPREVKKQIHPEDFPE